MILNAHFCTLTRSGWILQITAPLQVFYKAMEFEADERDAHPTEQQVLESAPWKQ